MHVTNKRSRLHTMARPVGTKNKRPTPDAQTRKAVGANLTAHDIARLDAFGERERARSGLEAKRGTLLLMAMRRGLDVIEGTGKAATT